jgi:hypothetical protein
MSNIHTWINTALIAGVVLAWVLVGGQPQQVTERVVEEFGGTTASTVTADNFEATNGTFCLQYHATSTATTLKITASSTAPTGSTPIMAEYGEC